VAASINSQEDTFNFGGGIVDRIAPERSDSISANAADDMRTRHMLKIPWRSTFTHFLVIIDVTP
jgi:hypothetical protein